MKTNQNIKSFALLVVLIFTVSVVVFTSNLDDSKGAVVSFVDTCREEMKNYLENKTFKSKILQKNNFDKSQVYREMVTEGQMPIIFDFSTVIEEITKANYKIDLVKNTHYAKSVDQEDIADTDTYHVQTGRSVYFINSDMIYTLADPDATNRKDYPQWVLEHNVQGKTYLYTPSSVVYWLMVPYESGSEFSIDRIVERDAGYSFKLEEIGDSYSMEVSNEGVTILKGIFDKSKIEKWKSLTYYTMDGALKSHLTAAYDLNGKVRQIDVFYFLNGYKDTYELSDLKDICDYYYSVDVESVEDTTFAEDYFDFSYNLKPEHAVFDRVNDVFYYGYNPESKIGIKEKFATHTNQ